MIDDLLHPTHFHQAGCENEFHAFEEKVLPLLENHNGILLYRIRPDASAFIHSAEQIPYEVQIVTFGRKKDFEGYKIDSRRLSYMEMKDRSVENVILIEGMAL